MKTYNMEQQTDEWFEVKKGKMSASHAQAISAAGKGLDTYVMEMMAEKYSQGEREFITNKDIERGNELEAQAVSTYELENDCTVETVGFIELNEYCGCSPDGLVNAKGLVEVKCPKDRVYFEYMLYRKIETKYMWQMQMQMLITGREWCDYVVYNPNFKKSIIIQRVLKDAAAQEKISKGLQKGIELLEKIEADYAVL